MALQISASLELLHTFRVTSQLQTRVRYLAEPFSSGIFSPAVIQPTIGFLCMKCYHKRSQPQTWGEGKMFDFTRITLVCLGYLLSKHKFTIFFTNLGAISTPMGVAQAFQKLHLTGYLMGRLQVFHVIVTQAMLSSAYDFLSCSSHRTEHAISHRRLAPFFVITTLPGGSHKAHLLTGCMPFSFGNQWQ